MKIALIGYGKMGKIIEQIALSRGHEIVSRIDIDNQEDFNSQIYIKKRYTVHTYIQNLTQCIKYNYSFLNAFYYIYEPERHKLKQKGKKIVLATSKPEVFANALKITSKLARKYAEIKTTGTAKNNSKNDIVKNTIKYKIYQRN